MFIGDKLAELQRIKARCILLENLVRKLKPLHNIQFWKSSTHSTVWIIITQNVWLFCSTKSWDIYKGSVAGKISWYNEYFPESDKFIFQVLVSNVPRGNHWVGWWGWLLFHPRESLPQWNWNKVFPITSPSVVCTFRLSKALSVPICSLKPPLAQSSICKKREISWLRYPHFVIVVFCPFLPPAWVILSQNFLGHWNTWDIIYVVTGQEIGKGTTLAI